MAHQSATPGSRSGSWLRSLESVLSLARASHETLGRDTDVGWDVVEIVDGPNLLVALHGSRVAAPSDVLQHYSAREIAWRNLPFSLIATGDGHG